MIAGQLGSSVAQRVRKAYRWNWARTPRTRMTVKASRRPTPSRLASPRPHWLLSHLPIHAAATPLSSFRTHTYSWHAQHRDRAQSDGARAAGTGVSSGGRGQKAVGQKKLIVGGAGQLCECARGRGAVAFARDGRDSFNLSRAFLVCHGLVNTDKVLQ